MHSEYTLNAPLHPYKTISILFNHTLTKIPEHQQYNLLKMIQLKGISNKGIRFIIFGLTNNILVVVVYLTVSIMVIIIKLT